MITYKIAHICEQGRDMIFIPLNTSFNWRTEANQREVVKKLQHVSASAGLDGTVVVFWPVGHSYSFIAPPEWRSMFNSAEIFERILLRLNKTLTIQ